MTPRVVSLVALVLAALPVFAAAPPSAAPAPLAGRIVGTVTDATTGEPLIGASARIAGTSIGAATDVEGQFSIASAPSGPQQLVVSYVGYRSDTLTVAVPEGGTVEVEVSLGSATFDEVVVTAQVAGQLGAINEQFRGSTVGNVVSRDRIQELPDNNAAESIGRLPGVSIQRSGGEASRVAIRGLSPKFNNVTVNGVRLPSTDGNDRAVDLSLVSSNVLDGIDVRKAITPDMDGDAIGGTVNLRLRNAPKGLSVDVLGQGGYTALQQELGNYKFVGTVSNRFFGNRLGVIATGNTERYDRSADKLGIGYDPVSSTSTNEGLIRVGSVNAREENVTRSRNGGSLLLDYALPGGRVTANAFYNSLDNDALNRSQFAALNALNYTVENANTETSILTSALGAEQDLGWLRYDGTVSYTRSRSDSPANQTFTFYQEASGFTVGSETLTELDPLDVGSRVRLDSTITLASLWEDSSQLDEDQFALQLNLQTPFRVGEWLTGYVKTGGKLRWLDRSFDANRSGRQGLNIPNANLYACLEEALPQYADDLSGGSLPISSVLLNYDRGEDFLDGQFGLGVVADEEQLAAILRGLQSGACASETDDPYAGEYFPDPISSLGRDYSGTEAYQAGYVMGRFDVGRYVTVIPGVRYERDESDYLGQRFRAVQAGGLRAAPPSEFEALEITRENAYWLPMLHLDVRPADWLSVRLARTETLARPGFNQYAPITSIDVYNTIIQASNSLLRPSQATNYDASVQVVRGNLGLVGVSGFHKTIDDLVLQVQYPTDVQIGVPEGTNIPPQWYEPQSVSPIVQTFINNREPTTFYGFELEWQTNFSYLPGALKGIVLNANYTRAFSEGTYYYYTANRTLERVPGQRFPVATVTLEETTRTGRMPDQAAHIANVTLGYDFRGFSTRLSYLFQSNTTAYINTQDALLDTFVGDYSRFDLAVSQKLRTGLEVFANLNNLNNRPDRVFTGQNPAGSEFSQRNPANRELYGFTADIGARYRF